MEAYYMEVQKTKDNLFIIKNNNTGKYVKLGPREYNYLLEVKKEDSRFMPRFDLGESMDLLLPDNLKEQLVQKFEEWGFLQDVHQDVTNRLSMKERFKDLSKIPVLILNPEKSVKATWGFYRVICSKFGVGLTVLLTLLSWYLLGLNGLEVAENLTVLKVDNWWSLVLLYVCVLITTVFHELGHIHICVKNGGKVKKFGIMLFFFNLSFYCDVSDIYMLGDSRVKRHVALGGVYINYIASRLALILYILCLMNGHNYVTVLYYYILNLGFAIFNLNPFVRLDGYWVLASIAKIDNLMDKCVLYMLSCFYDRDLVRRAGLRGRKKVLVFLYGVAVCIVRPLFWLVGVSYLYEILNKNFGIWAASGVLVILVLIIIWDTLKLILYYKNAFLKDRERIVMLI